MQVYFYFIVLHFLSFWYFRLLLCWTRDISFLRFSLTLLSFLSFEWYCIAAMGSICKMEWWRQEIDFVFFHLTFYLYFSIWLDCISPFDISVVFLFSNVQAYLLWIRIPLRASKQELDACREKQQNTMAWIVVQISPCIYIFVFVYIYISVFLYVCISYRILSSA